MLILYHNIFDTKRRIFPIKGNRVRIGRAPQHNDLVLDDTPLVGERAAELIRGGDGWEFQALGLDCTVEGAPVPVGERVPVKVGARFTVPLFEFVLDADRTETEAPGRQAEATHTRLDERAADFIRRIHVDLLGRMDVRPDAMDPDRVTTEALLVLEKHIEDIAVRLGVGESAEADLTFHVAGLCLRSEILYGLISSSHVSDAWGDKGHWSQLATAVPDRERDLKVRHRQFLGKLRLESADFLDAFGKPDLDRQMDAVEERYWEHWDAIRAELFREDLQYMAMRQLKTEIKDITFGYGPLEDLLRTPAISEIMVVDSRHIYIEKGGKIKNSGRRFVSDEVTEAIIQRIVRKASRQINRSMPLVDARLTDGSRVNAIIAPIAVSGPCLTVRKFPHRKLTIDRLVEVRSMTETVAKFLQACIEARCNVLVAGGTGTGKTTLLNCLSDFIPNDERIVTIEDTTELQLAKEHVVRLETKPKTAESKTEYRIADLVRNALRMRPDRIVVGECRGPEALDMLQAMNTGHDGSLTTIHANSAEDVVLRLEVLVQSASPGLPVSSIRRQIASAVDLVVQLRRMRDGARRIAQVTEYLDVDPSTGEIRMKDLFLLEGEDSANLAGPTGHLPSFMEKLMDLKNNPIRWENLFEDKPVGRAEVAT